MIIECKYWQETLDKHDSQLHRYFHVTKAKFWILTNWLVYKFFTDLDDINKMDSKPFLTINIENINENILSEIIKFQKSNFDVDKITDSASLLKYSNIINNFFRKEINDPTDDFIKFLAWMVYDGKVTKNVIEKLRPVVSKALQQFVNDIANEKLKSALWEKISKTIEEKNSIQEKKSEEKTKEEPETTIEELEGFFIIKGILRSKIDVSRLKYKDSLSYFGIFIDHTRKPLCRLRFNGGKKYIWIMDIDKKETKYEITNVDQIHKYKSKIIKIAEEWAKE